MQARQVFSRLPTGVRRMSSDCRSSNGCSTSKKSESENVIVGFWLLGIVPYWVGLASYDAYTEHREYRKFERQRTSSSYRGDYNGLKGHEHSRVKSAREAASVGFWRNTGGNAVFALAWPLHATGEVVSEAIDWWSYLSEKLTE